MLTTLRRRNFALLWAGGFVSLTGNWTLFIALPIYVYNLTGSTLVTGSMFMARFLPSFLLSSVAGVYVDRWDRRRTLVTTNAILAVIITPLLVVRSGSTLWLVYFVAFAESTVSLFLGAEGALLPRLVPHDELVTANSLYAVSQNVARLVGPAIAGVLMATLGLAGITTIDVASYVVAGAMAAAVRVPPRQGETVAGSHVAPVPSALTRVWVEWRAGLQVVRRDELLSRLFVIWGLAALAEGAFEVLVVPWIHVSLQGGAQDFGWLMSAQAIGGIVGGLSIGWAGRHLRPPQMIAGSMLAVGIADIAIWNTPHLLFDLVVIAVLGLPAIGFTVGTTTLMQRNVVDAFRGRVGGALGTTWSASILLAMAAASLLGGAVSVVAVLNASGVLALITGFAALRLREHRRDDPPTPEAETIRVEHDHEEMSDRAEMSSRLDLKVDRRKRLTVALPAASKAICVNAGEKCSLTPSE